MISNIPKITYYTDLDDTLSENSCLFYSKIKVLSQKTKNEKNVYDLIIKDFKINKRFLELAKKLEIKEVFILSRNKQSFIDYFIEHTKNIFKKYNITIIGGLGNITTESKIENIPKDSFLISDMFEYKKLKKYPNFISIDKYSFPKHMLTFSKKLIRFLFFIISLQWKKF